MLVAATLPNFGQKSIDAYVNKHFGRAARAVDEGAMHRTVAGLEQTWTRVGAAPAERHAALAAALEDDNGAAGADGDDNGAAPRRPPEGRTMVFANTARDAVAAAAFLRNRCAFVAAGPRQD